MTTMEGQKVMDCKLSKCEILRGIVTDKLTSAAREIFAAVERTVSGYEEEAAGLRREVDRQRIQLEALLQPRVSLCRTDGDALGSRDSSGPAEDEEAEPEKNEDRKSASINLRVCLLQDSTVRMLRRGELKLQVKDLSCPPGLQEADFLDLLRASFPQLTGGFEAFTVDARRRLRPLTVKTLTPEETRRSIRSTGRGRAALYVRVKAAEESLTCQEQHPPSANTKDGVEDADAASLSEQITREEEECETSAHLTGRAAVDGGEEEEEWKADEDDTEWNEESPREDSPGKKASGVKSKRREPMEWSENSSAPLSCKVCKALSGSKNMLIKHSWSHVEDPERRCGVCGDESESPEELRNHLEAHKKTFSCDVCGKKFLSVVGFQRHAALHTGEKPYECDICNKVFSLKTSLRNHRLVHVEEKPHKCDICSKSFAFKQQLRTHVVSHTGEKPYTCDLCGKSVLDLNSLSRHKMSHSGDKRYSCGVCGKSFLTPAGVRGHEKIHTVRDKPYLCDVCCKTFHSQSVLSVHLKTHGEKEICCSTCGKALSSKGALRRHLLVHSGEKPYKCSECGRTFNARGLLTSHLKTHAGIKPFVCGVCGKACSRKEHLSVHMRTHNGEKPYKCSVCERGFTQSHCLKTHMKSHQGQDKSAGDGPMEPTF